MNRFNRFLSPIFLIAILAWTYASTLAPGLTWANGGADGGDLIAATATGGVPHPTGYPLYLILAGLFQHIPIGPLAFRFNLFSAVSAISAAYLLYEVTRRALPDSDSWTTRLSALAAALTFGLSPLFWSQAVITEVYSLHALLVAAVLYLSSVPIPDLTPKQHALLLGLIFGLALGNHITAILLAPIVFLPGSKNLHSLGSRLLGLTLGLLPYLLLPLRALSDPPINWGDPITLRNFFWLVSGKLYQPLILSTTWTAIWERTRSAAALTITQIGIIGAALAVMGLFLSFSNRRLVFNTIWTALAFFVFSVSYGVRNSQVYLIPVFLCFSIWIGVALARLSSGGKLVVVVFAIFAGYLIFLGSQAWPQVDASHDLRAEEFGQGIIEEAPPDALIFVKGDDAVFALWYFHFALGERSDVSVIASELLHHDWYQKSLRDAYPGLVIPGPLPFEETIRLANPTRPVCYVSVEQGDLPDCRDPLQVSP